MNDLRNRVIYNTSLREQLEAIAEARADIPVRANPKLFHSNDNLFSMNSRINLQLIKAYVNLKILNLHTLGLKVTFNFVYFLFFNIAINYKIVVNFK